MSGSAILVCFTTIVFKMNMTRVQILFWFVLLSLLYFCKSRLLFGFRTKEYAYLTSSGTLSPHGFHIVDSYEWLRPMGDKAIAGLQGDASDCEDVFSKLTAVSREHLLRSVDSSISMSAEAVGNVCRSLIADKLNKGQHLDVNGLVAGWNEKEQLPKLYWLDSIGSIKEVPYAAHGNEFPLVLSLFDNQRSKSRISDNEHILDWSEDESVNFVKTTWEVVKKRKVESVGPCRLMSVGRDGCKDLGILR